MSNGTSAANTANKKKRPSAGKIVLICLGCAAALALLYLAITFANHAKGEPLPSEAPAPTEQAAYTVEHIIRYWPLDADYNSCDYACIMDKPVFAKTQTAGAAMNKAVEAYFEGLFERIENEYTPAAIADPPYTEVKCEVENYGEYTNVVFTEEHCYEAQPYKTTRTLILNARGTEVNANDVFRTYHGEERIAKAVLELMKKAGYCYEAELNDVLARLDIANACVVDDNGATVFLPEGVFAPYDYGELSFTVPAEQIMPDIVGSTLTREEYEAISRLTDAAASANIVRGSNVEDGVCTEYAATAFMGTAILRQGRASEKGRINLPAEEFDGYYRSCFGKDFPGIDTDGFDIRIEDGVYSISASQKTYEYHVDMLSAERTGDGLKIEGEVVFGGYGYPYSTPVCRVEIRLEKNAESPYGYELRDFIMSL